MSPLSITGKAKNGFCSFLLLFFSCTSSGAVTADRSLTGLLDRIERIRNETNIAAIGIAIVENRKPVWTGGLGTLSHTSKAPITGKTLFRIGSITKSFTSLAVVKLVEQEQLNLQDRMDKWIPESWYQNQWEKQSPVRLVHLLEHTAGFRDMSKAEFGYNNPKPLPVAKTLEQFKQLHKTYWPPGMHASYSNVGAGFAGFIIEQVSELAYEDFVQDEIFKPLDMRDSGFFISDAQRDQMLMGYNTDGVTPIPYWHMVYRPFGGINSTAEDMSHFLQMLIDKGRFQDKQVFQPQSIEHMEVPRSTLAAGKGLSYGYGLGNYQWLHKGILFHGHGGDADGYLSRYGYTRSNNSGYFVVISAFNHKALREIDDAIESYLTRGLTPPEPPPEATLEPETLTNIQGIYKSVTSRFEESQDTLTVFTESGSVYTRKNGSRKRLLIPVSRELFRRSDQPLATTLIAEGGDGNIYYQDESDNFVKLPNP